MTKEATNNHAIEKKFKTLTQIFCTDDLYEAPFNFSVNLGGVYTERGFSYFKFEYLVEFMKKKRLCVPFSRCPESQMREWLEEMGAKKIRKYDWGPKEKSVTLWRIPEFNKANDPRWSAFALGEI